MLIGKGSDFQHLFADPRFYGIATRTKPDYQMSPARSKVNPKWQFWDLINASNQSKCKVFNGRDGSNMALPPLDRFYSDGTSTYATRDVVLL